MFAAKPSSVLALLLSTSTIQEPPAPRPALELPASRPYAALASLAPPAEGSVRFYLLRHGESVGNATGDDPKLTDAEKDRLTDTGRAQAEALGRAVKLMGVTRLCHSPAARAAQTAEGASRAAFGDGALASVKLDEVAPMSLGKPTGAGASAAAFLVSRWRKGEDPALESGESLAGLCARLRRGVSTLRERAVKSNQPLAIVCHGEVQLAYLCDFDAAELRRLLLMVRIANGSILAFDVDAAQRVRCVGHFTP